MEARRTRRDAVMPMSHDVCLPRGRVPVFPPRCVACGGRPETTVRVSTRSIGWWTIVLLTGGRRVRADVPACHACAGRMRRERVVNLLADAAVIVGGAGIAIWLLGWYRGPFRKHLLVAVTVACCLPAILWEVFRPPPIGLTARSDTVDYEFRDFGYASDFAAANGGTVD